MYFEFKGTNVRLLGTLHLFPSDRPELPQWVIQAYEWSKALVFESHPPALLPFFRSIDGLNLQSKIPSGIYSELSSIWPQAGPLAPLADLKPWGALFGYVSLKQSAVTGVEMQLHERIKLDGKPLGYLETADDVSAGLDAAPAADIQRCFELLLADPDEPQRALTKMHGAWLEKDSVKLGDILRQAPLYKMPNLRRVILDRRNALWAPQIVSLLNSSIPTLVCVGALHLCSPGSVLDLIGREVVPV
jgi:uncharacterized protein YbaP (TraB family)